MNSYSKGIGGFILASLLAVAFTGYTPTISGFHQQCIDGIDNGDGDGMIDGNDMECLTYPFDDGGGEFLTTQGKKWSSDQYEFTILQYQAQYGDPSVQNELCNNQPLKQSEFDNIQTESGGKDTSGDDYPQWILENCPP